MMPTYIPGVDSQTTNIVSLAPDSSWTSALDNIAPGFTSMLDDNTVATGDGTGSSDWVSRAFQLMTAVQMSDTQRRLLNVQLDRASKGLPPLDASQYSLGVNVGLAPQTQNLLLWGGLGLLGLLAFGVFSRR